MIKKPPRILILGATLSGAAFSLGLLFCLTQFQMPEFFRELLHRSFGNLFLIFLTSLIALTIFGSLIGLANSINEIRRNSDR